MPNIFVWYDEIKLVYIFILVLLVVVATHEKQVHMHINHRSVHLLFKVVGLNVFY